MTASWDRGVLNQSSWHQLETVGEFSDVSSLINHGEDSGAWPTSVHLTETFASFQGRMVKSFSRAVLAQYRNHPERVVGNVGGRYTPCNPHKWRQLCAAAVAAGATPTGAFSLREGKVVIATFQVNGSQDGIVTQLLMADSFDGSLRLSVGKTSIRVMCANTLAAAFRSDGKGMSQLSHTSSIDEEINILAAQIQEAITSGKSMRDLYRAAKSITLNRDQMAVAFDALFPDPNKAANKAANKEDMSKQLFTRLLNARSEAKRAAILPVNSEGGTLATLWNAATYVVDREVNAAGESTMRETKGDSDMLDSLLFGQRSKRITEVQDVIVNIVQMVDRAGNVVDMPVPDAAQTESQKLAFSDLLGKRTTIDSDPSEFV